MELPVLESAQRRIREVSFIAMNSTDCDTKAQEQTYTLYTEQVTSGLGVFYIITCIIRRSSFVRFTCQRTLPHPFFNFPFKQNGFADMFSFLKMNTWEWPLMRHWHFIFTFDHRICFGYFFMFCVFCILFNLLN